MAKTDKEKIIERQKENVAIIFKCYKHLEDNLKRTILENYCQNCNYNVVGTQIIGDYTTIDVLDLTFNMLIKNENISKIVIFKADELTDNQELLFSIYKILEEANITIESMADGVIGKNLSFKLDVYKNVYLCGREQ